MRHSLRRALSLDSVDGGTHNPTIAARQDVEAKNDAFLLAETNTPPFASTSARGQELPIQIRSASVSQRLTSDWVITLPVWASMGIDNSQQL